MGGGERGASQMLSLQKEGEGRSSSHAKGGRKCFEVVFMWVLKVLAILKGWRVTKVDIS